MFDVCHYNGENMIENDIKSNCCGCSACANICPQKCIIMIPDEEGFLYPKVDAEKCIHCGKCKNVCPFENYMEPTDEISTECYAAQYNGSASEQVLSRCASGGVYTALAEYILGQGGVTVGAGFDDALEVRHIIISERQQFLTHSGSKYVQSQIDNIYMKTKEILELGEKVLFSGTPCQVAGLKYFLGKDYEYLYCIDIICAGVASPKVFRAYKTILENKYSSSLKEVNFKHKTYGYHSSTMSLVFSNGKKYAHSRLTDLMMRCFTSRICDRPSCEKCVIRGKNRVSDLSLFDCWHYEALT